MPIFGGKKPKTPKESSQHSDTLDVTAEKSEEPTPDTSPAYRRRKIQFHCQLAQGSPTGIISDFSDIKELYSEVASCYGIDATEVLFCTLNTHRIDMTQLLGGEIALDDFIFVHVKGQPKVVDVEKSEAALGLTITDNGAGYAFIRAIRDGSLTSRIEGICVGDHVEKINDVSVVGSRHYEVAKALKDIPVGSTFSLRLVEPLKSGFSEIGAKADGASSKKGSGSGKETLRLRSKGAATFEVVDEMSKIAVEKINNLLEIFIGISDSELAQTIWEIGRQVGNPSDFAVAVSSSDLCGFNFSDSFIFDLWGAVSDAQQGRLQPDNNEQTHF